MILSSLGWFNWRLHPAIAKTPNVVVVSFDADIGEAVQNILTISKAALEAKTLVSIRPLSFEESHLFEKKRFRRLGMDIERFG